MKKEWFDNDGEEIPQIGSKGRLEYVNRRIDAALKRKPKSKKWWRETLNFKKENRP